MKRLLLLCVAIAGCFYSVAQQSTKGFSLENIKEIKQRAGRASIYCMSVKVDDKFWVKSSTAQDFYNSNSDSLNTINGTQNYEPLIDSVYIRIGEDFALIKDDYSRIFKYKNGNLLLFQTLRGTSVYNEARLTEYEMTAMCVRNIILPFAYKISDLIPVDIDYIALMVGYPYRDLSEKYGSLNFGGCALLVVPVSALKEYVNTYITEQDLLKQSDLYSQSHKTELRRISIK